jgi:hypothetical protein
MKQVFKAHQLCRQDGPLDPYLNSYEAEMRSEGYAQQTREVQVRLVADFKSLVDQTWNPSAEDHLRIVSAISSRTIPASTSDKKRCIRIAPPAGVVEARGSG